MRGAYHPVHALLDHFCILLHTSSPSSAPLALHRWLDAAVNVHPAPPHPRMAGASACVRHAVGLLASRMLLHLCHGCISCSPLHLSRCSYTLYFHTQSHQIVSLTITQYSHFSHVLVASSEPTASGIA